MDKGKLNEVLNTKVGGKTIERYFGDLLAQAEKTEVDMEKVKLQNSVLKQWNSHHREVNASYRIEVREKECVIDSQRVALQHMKEANRMLNLKDE